MNDIPSTEGVTNFGEGQNITSIRIANDDRHFSGSQVALSVNIDKVPCDSMKCRKESRLV